MTSETSTSTGGALNTTYQLIDTAGEVLEAIINEVQGHFKQLNKHAGVIKSLKAFVAAVDWTVRELCCICLLVSALGTGSLCWT